MPSFLDPKPQHPEMVYERRVRSRSIMSGLCDMEMRLRTSHARSTRGAGEYTWAGPFASLHGLSKFHSVDESRGCCIHISNAERVPKLPNDLEASDAEPENIRNSLFRISAHTSQASESLSQRAVCFGKPRCRESCLQPDRERRNQCSSCKGLHS